jgi:hypothetical protein
MDKINKKILFYTSIPRAFRATLIGYLYELSRFHSIILLSEDIDVETQRIVADKTIFPGVEKIIKVDQYKKENIFKKNRRLKELAKNIIKECRPDVIILPGDMYPLFELYLSRFAKKERILNISLQPSNITESFKSSKWVDLTNAFTRFSNFFPFSLRYFFVKTRKSFGHFLYYFILPIFAGEKPFFGKSSFILRKGISGMRDSDYQIALSERDYDIYLREGVLEKKLYILEHPLSREKTREFFFETFLRLDSVLEKTITLLLPSEIDVGFRGKNLKLILKKERENSWVETVLLINKTLSDWKINIKPHPASKNITKIKEKLELISKNIKVIEPQEPIDKYLQMAQVIIELPLSVSTALFTASLQCPDKPIISLDLFKEFYGDIYKNFTGIDYSDTEEDLLKKLNLIKTGKYKKENKKPGITKKYKSFSGANDMLEFLYFNREK